MSGNAGFFDSQIDALGEGIIRNPMRNSVIWFDILKQKMFEKKPTFLQITE